MNKHSRAPLTSHILLVLGLLTASLCVARPANATHIAAPQPALLQLPKEPGITGWDDDTIDTAMEPTSRRGRNPVYAAVGTQRYAR
jgi:hypothetical protein